MTFTFYIHFVHFISLDHSSSLVRITVVYVVQLYICKKGDEDASDLDLDQISIEKTHF